MGRSSIAVLACLLVATACGPAARPPATPDSTSLRHPPAGDVVGFLDDYGAHAWLGIPYAAPPTGERRWRAPVPGARWEGVREALAFGSPCPQLASRFGGVPGPPGSVQGDEDCLFLNVYAPRAGSAAAATAARRPVMVWIHGGGNVVGHAGFYDGGNLAASQNVVVVTVNYRLGPLGWFRHPALRTADTSPEDASGNFGLLDLVRALEWVRDDIAAFGGDPGNVTIFGESAGGRNVAALLLAPKAAGLFHRAIVESGRFTLDDVAEAEATGDNPAVIGPGSGLIAERLLIERGEARNLDEAAARLAAMKPEEIAGRLRWTRPDVLLRLYGTRPDADLMAVPQVFADGTVLPAEPPLERFRTGRWNQVPVLLGTNRDEQKLFMFASDDWVTHLFWLIPRVRDPQRYDLFAEQLSRFWKATAADEPAAAMRAGGHADVWIYRFDWDEEPTILGADLGHLLGAAHGLEIPFVFGHWDLGPEVNRVFTTGNAVGRATLASAMMGAWVSLATRGAPADWPRAPALNVLDTPAGGGVRAETPPLLTEEAVLEAAAQDPRLGGPGERCELLRALLRVAVRHGPADLPLLGGPACA
jgi:para-nitrobenzyl esterase